MSNNTSTTTTTTLPSPTDLLTAEARNAIESTKAETIKNKTRTEHGRKVQQLVSFIINNHREISNTILVDITPAQKQHVAYPFSSTAMKDINESDQRMTDITLSFLQSKTFKANSTQTLTLESIMMLSYIARNSQIKHYQPLLNSRESFS